MKYVIDADALKSCLELLEVPARVCGCDLVRIDDVKELIDRFPKGSFDVGPITRSIDCEEGTRLCRNSI